MINTLEEFLHLVNQDDEVSRRRLKTEVAAPFVWELVLSLHPDLKRIVTLNRTLGESILRQLAQDVDASVRCDVANRRNLPTDLFELLARDGDESVRARIAWNKKTPAHILSYLSSDESEIVTAAIKKESVVASCY